MGKVRGYGLEIIKAQFSFILFIFVERSSRVYYTRFYSRWLNRSIWTNNEMKFRYEIRFCSPTIPITSRFNSFE